MWVFNVQQKHNRFTAYLRENSMLETESKRWDLDVVATREIRISGQRFLPGGNGKFLYLFEEIWLNKHPFEWDRIDEKMQGNSL